MQRKLMVLAAAAAIVAAARCSHCVAAEPNETFATATVLTSGVLIVSDELTGGFSNEPDTLLGIRNPIGDIDETNDNDSVYGNGFASGANNVPIPLGAISFAVTGYPNFSFDGLHDENGIYKVYVDVYEEEDDDTPLASFSEQRTLAVDAVDEFSFFDNAWVNASYYVNIDNQIATGGDVDFFRFTGLTAGASFTAETLSSGGSEVDTFLGWYSSEGSLLASDDDGADAPFSKLQGAVPTGGALTFAVTGFEDDLFEGQHFENGAYQLKLTIGGGTFSADFDRSGGVREADLALWRSNFHVSATGDADGDSDTDGHDFLLWQRQLGSGVGAAQIPEPAAMIMASCVLVACGVARRRAPRRNALDAK